MSKCPSSAELQSGDQTLENLSTAPVTAVVDTAISNEMTTVPVLNHEPNIKTLNNSDASFLERNNFSKESDTNKNASHNLDTKQLKENSRFKLIEQELPRVVECAETNNEITEITDGCAQCELSRDKINILKDGQLESELNMGPSMLPGSNTDPSVLPRSNMEPSVLPESYTEPSMLLGSNMEPSMLPGSNMEPSVLPGSNTEHSFLPGSNMETSVLPGSNMEPSVLPGSNTEHSLLPESNMEPSVLPGSNTEHSMLTGSNTKPGRLPGSNTDNIMLPGSNSDPGVLPRSNMEPILLSGSNTEPSMLHESYTEYSRFLTEDCKNTTLLSDDEIRSVKGTCEEKNDNKQDTTARPSITLDGVNSHDESGSISESEECHKDSKLTVTKVQSRQNDYPNNAEIDLLLYKLPMMKLATEYLQKGKREPKQEACKTVKYESTGDVLCHLLETTDHNLLQFQTVAGNETSVLSPNKRVNTEDQNHINQLVEESFPVGSHKADFKIKCMGNDVAKIENLGKKTVHVHAAYVHNLSVLNLESSADDQIKADNKNDLPLKNDLFKSDKKDIDKLVEETLPPEDCHGKLKLVNNEQSKILASVENCSAQNQTLLTITVDSQYKTEPSSYRTLLTDEFNECILKDDERKLTSRIIQVKNDELFSLTSKQCATNEDRILESDNEIKILENKIKFLSNKQSTECDDMLDKIKGFEKVVIIEKHAGSKDLSHEKNAANQRGRRNNYANVKHAYHNSEPTQDIMNETELERHSNYTSDPEVGTYCIKAPTISPNISLYSSQGLPSVMISPRSSDMDNESMSAWLEQVELSDDKSATHIDEHPCCTPMGQSTDSIVSDVFTGYRNCFSISRQRMPVNDEESVIVSDSQIPPCTELLRELPPHSLFKCDDQAHQRSVINNSGMKGENSLPSNHCGDSPTLDSSPRPKSYGVKWQENLAEKDRVIRDLQSANNDLRKELEDNRQLFKLQNGLSIFSTRMIIK